MLAQSEYRREEKLERLEESRRLMKNQRKQEAFPCKDVGRSEKILIAGGMKPGKEIEIP